MSFRKQPRTLTDLSSTDQSIARRATTFKTSGPVSFDTDGVVSRGLRFDGIRRQTGPMEADGLLFYYELARISLDVGPIGGMGRNRGYEFSGYAQLIGEALNPTETSWAAMRIVEGYDVDSGAFNTFHLQMGFNFPTQFDTWYCPFNYTWLTNVEGEYTFSLLARSLLTVADGAADIPEPSVLNPGTYAVQFKVCDIGIFND